MTQQVALFVTCLVDLMRPRIGFAAIRALEAAGCDVIVPQGQTCCGQPALNSGDRDHADVDIDVKSALTSTSMSTATSTLTSRSTSILSIDLEMTSTLMSLQAAELFGPTRVSTERGKKFPV